jgi:hypothetical protein
MYNHPQTNSTKTKTKETGRVFLFGVDVYRPADSSTALLVDPGRWVLNFSKVCQMCVKSKDFQPPLLIYHSFNHFSDI